VIFTTDTIIAIATPRGRGALGVVRLSGGESINIAMTLARRTRAFETRRATLCRIHDIDEAVVTVFRAPASFTGQDVVELSAHGSPAVLDAIVDAGLALGARMARPGEFTLRAVLNGRRDLIQAEAVADLIESTTTLQARTAFDQLQGTLTARIREIEVVLFDLQSLLEASLDFPDEGYRFIAEGDVVARLNSGRSMLRALLADARTGRLVREGATVVLAGRANVGKSSLFNRLVGRERAIVSPTAGTTRDFVTESVGIDGLVVTLVDTAGRGFAGDDIEAEGMTRALAAQQAADVVLVVVDGSMALLDEDLALLSETDGSPRLVLWSKSDLADAGGEMGRVDGSVAVSAMTGDGLSEVRARLVGLLCGEERGREAPAVSNIRHIRLLEQSGEHLARAERAILQESAPEEFVLFELGAAREVLEEVTGARGSEAVLEEVFARFCIGK
jgi:tRNA modification GTPase